MLTYERAHEVFCCDPSTGDLVWKRRPHPQARAIKPGQSAGCRNIRTGYRDVSIDKRAYPVHRIIYLMVHGEWPAGEIDHINGIKHDNRIANLRVATHTQNMANKGAYKNSKTGVKGVSYHKRDRKYYVCISASGKQHHVGSFKTIADAQQAYAEAAKRLHGDFARLV